MSARSKRYLKEAGKTSKEPLVLAEAVDKVKSFEAAGFDESIECVLTLGIQAKKSDQLVRGVISLPNGIGKQRRVVAFCKEAQAEQARQAGAVEAGEDELVKKVSEGWMDFDVAIATPGVMSKVGKLGKILGPQGKMPSPKKGTVTKDVAAAVREFAAGKVEFRNDAGGNVHVPVGKGSFDKQKLVENIQAFLEYINKLRPAAAKGKFIRKMSLSATMSPGVAVKC